MPHNGNLEGFQPPLRSRFRPVGDTDSEAAFCLMLEELCARFPDEQPPLPDLLGALADLTAQIARHGPFNYLLSNGEHLIARCATRLSYLVRQAPFGAAHLVDEDVTVDFGALTTPRDRVAVIATDPLTTNEAWTALTPGQLAVFRDGEVIQAV